MLLCGCTNGKEITYRGSTPANAIDVRQFLGMPLADSIDFIRWKIAIHPDRYELSCQYGIGKPNTNGFWDEKRVAFSGKYTKNGHQYTLQHGDKSLSMLEINANLVHLLDNNNNTLMGNGGWSYTLNNIHPVKSKAFNQVAQSYESAPYMVLEGRTPCKDAASSFSLRNESDCYKLKWLFVLYTDPATGKPSHFLTGGRGYRKETMDKGKWEIIRDKDGRWIFKLYHEKYPEPLYLLRVDDTILVFTDPEGNLLVGNEDFSYTLNRTRRKMP